MWLLDWLDNNLAGRTLVAVGHRVVHGGVAFAEPIRLNADVMAQLEALVPLAPNAMMAAEMALIRLTHVADLPDPEALIKRLQSQPAPVMGGPPAGGGGGTVHAPMMRMAPVAPMRGPTMQGVLFENLFQS